MAAALPCVQGLRYDHLLVAVTNLDASIDFYCKVGFRLRDEQPASDRLRVLENSGGLRLHLYLSQRGWQDGKNGLMDLGDEGHKYPGHTHMSFGVRSVAATRAYFESAATGLAISGTRGSLAIFVRDPDRTVLEFENNTGDDGSCEAVTAELLSAAPRGGIDHIGTRISKPDEHCRWYQSALGYTQWIMQYPADASNPRSNARPWILRSQHGLGSEFDENLIINATTSSPVNILLDEQDGQDPLPGIVVAAVQVHDVAVAARAYRERFGSESIIDEADSARWGIPAAAVLPARPPSVFVRDPDHNVFRLVSPDSLAQ